MAEKRAPQEQRVGRTTDQGLEAGQHYTDKDKELRDNRKDETLAHLEAIAPLLRAGVGYMGPLLDSLRDKLLLKDKPQERDNG